MNNRKVKTIKIILRTRSKYEEMKNVKDYNSEFIIQNYSNEVLISTS